MRTRTWLALASSVGLLGLALGPTASAAFPFQVRATAGGVTDPTPAKRSWKITEN